jgi:hypothetical protein
VRARLFFVAAHPYNSEYPWPTAKEAKTMSKSYELLLAEALRLPAEQQRELAERLLAGVNRGVTGDNAEPRKARRHFGAWDSGDERSADNDRIDLDLAREYGNSR